MSQSTLIVGGLLVAFLVWLLANNRLPTYVGIFGAGKPASGTASTTTGGAAGAVSSAQSTLGSIAGTFPALGTFANVLKSIGSGDSGGDFGGGGDQLPAQDFGGGGDLTFT